MKPIVEVPPVPAKEWREKRTPSYRHQAQVEEGVDIEELLTRFVGNEVKLTQKELLAIAPKVREAYKDMIVKKRIPTATTVQEVEAEPDLGTEEEELDLASIEFVSVNTLAAPVKVCERSVDPLGQYIQTWWVKDPVMQYLDTLPVNDRERQIFTVAKEVPVAAKDM
ncbi:hypothetical protein P691DRAFT_628025, partial [Macrolepiota fuliginosa MF-IS2]